ncbi:MAG TPA: formate--tetrahydrofolate ligase [Planctomycetota bacterium]|nr:formate--tetrahydrofolate ligase [Planctomycetota bacterium]
MTTEPESPRAEGLRPIGEIAAALGLADDEVEPYGRHAAKIGEVAWERRRERPDGRLILVTAITPTPLGEGKTTCTVGLAQGLRRLGVKASCTLRQPSLGPIFGIKGGGAGGGRSQVEPTELVNLHLTGDMHAVAAAHNLASAFLDNALHHGVGPEIDPAAVAWPRVMDMNDRALRRVVIGLGGKANGPAREEEWWITAASEVMAVLALAENLADLRRRLGRIVAARDRSGRPVTLEDLHVAGAMAALLKDAVKPNLVQTTEGCPAFVHAGPFANIAHGCSSVAADRIALKTSEAVCTEAGFGADMGAEKFFDIKCRQSRLAPSAAVVVATVRALKMHGGVGRISAGKPLDPALLREDVDAVRRGADNLAKHVENVLAFGVPAVVAINAFPQDTEAEFAAVREAALAAGALDAIPARHFSEGGAGAEDLARATWAAATGGAAAPRPLYGDDLPLAEKIEMIARRMYGADGVDFAPEAARRLEAFEREGRGRLSICMAKTQASLSHDPALKNRPRGFRLPVRDVRLSAGAGFVVAVTGNMSLMPGLPSEAAGAAIDVDADGRIVGLR